MLEYLISDEIVCQDDRIAVGVSGGADSMLLLWALIDKQKQTGYHLEVIHVNHNLRGKESDGDAEFVKTFCEKKKVPYKIISVDVQAKKNKEKTTLEETARDLRYKAIYDTMKSDKLNKLFLAHHKNDQVESVLMHLFRGSGISGMCGMMKSESIYRPLLELDKNQILKLVADHGIKFVVDSSNLKNDTSRNYLRNIVLPEIEKIYPGVFDAVYEFSKKCNLVQKYIEKLANNGTFVRENDYILLKGDAFEGESFVVHERIKMSFEMLGILSDIEEKHYNLIASLMDCQVGSTLDMPHQIKAKRTYQGIKLYKHKNENAIELNYPFLIGEIEFAGFGKIITELVERDSVVYGDGSLYADMSKIPIGAIWRNRQIGDTFSKLGTGSKKLNDYFTDKKIDSDKRSSLPVLATNNSILVVAENDISEGVKIDGETEQIVKIKFMPN